MLLSLIPSSSGVVFGHSYDKLCQARLHEFVFTLIYDMRTARVCIGVGHCLFEEECKEGKKIDPWVDLPIKSGKA